MPPRRATPDIRWVMETMAVIGNLMVDKSKLTGRFLFTVCRYLCNGCSLHVGIQSNPYDYAIREQQTTQSESSKWKAARLCFLRLSAQQSLAGQN